MPFIIFHRGYVTNLSDILSLLFVVLWMRIEKGES